MCERGYKRYLSSRPGASRESAARALQLDNSAIHPMFGASLLARLPFLVFLTNCRVAAGKLSSAQNTRFDFLAQIGSFRPKEVGAQWCFACRLFIGKAQTVMERGGRGTRNDAAVVMGEKRRSHQQFIADRMDVEGADEETAENEDQKTAAEKGTDLLGLVGVEKPAHLATATGRLQYERAVASAISAKSGKQGTSTGEAKQKRKPRLSKRAKRKLEKLGLSKCRGSRCYLWWLALYKIGSQLTMRSSPRSRSAPLRRQVRTRSTWMR